MALSPTATCPEVKLSTTATSRNRTCDPTGVANTGAFAAAASLAVSATELPPVVWPSDSTSTPASGRPPASSSTCPTAVPRCVPTAPAAASSTAGHSAFAGSTGNGCSVSAKP